MKKLKRKDKVIVTTGKSKGVVGDIKRVVYRSLRNNKERIFVIVEGANLIIKHVKPILIKE